MKTAKLIAVLLVVLGMVGFAFRSLYRSSPMTEVAQTHKQRKQIVEDEQPSEAAPQKQHSNAAMEPMRKSPPIEEPEERAEPETLRDPGNSAMEAAIGHVQTMFSTQPPDGSWTHEMRSKAEDVVRAAAQEGSTLRAVDCRASICRVEIAHNDEDHYRNFSQHIRNFSDDEMAFMRNGNGPTEDWTMVVYVARHGFELPKLD